MALIILLTALVTFIILLLIYKFVTRREEAVNLRITKYVEPVKKEEVKLSIQSVSKSWLEIVRFLSPYVTASPKASYFNRKLIQAGIPLRGAEFLVIVILVSIAVGLIGFVLTKGGFLAGVGMAIMTYLLFHVYVNIKITQRLKAFDHQLGETLSLMANALRSGHSFLQTVDMVSREMTPPISQEFGRMLKELNLGAPTETALDNLLNRIKSEDLDLAVTAVLIQRQIGGNLAEIMDNIATTIRERHMMKREIQTLTAQGRISGWIVGLLPFGLFLLLWVVNGNFVEPLFRDSIGHVLIAYGLISQLIGIFIVRKIVDIEL